MEVTREAIDHIESVEEDPTIFLGVKPGGCVVEYESNSWKDIKTIAVDDCADVTSTMDGILYKEQYYIYDPQRH